MKRSVPRTLGAETRTPVAWLTLLAIVGTLSHCGRYGPPPRRPTGAPATSEASAPSQASESEAPTADEDPRRGK